jgi:hypothetical protein
MYVIIAVPADMPETIPDPAITVATEGSLLVQVPPASVLESAVTKPTHTWGIPSITAGRGSTLIVTTSSDTQPALLVALTVYILTPLTDGVIVGLVQVEQERSLPPVHA